MTDFYQTMLGRQEQHTSSIDQEIVQLGQTLSLDQQLQLCQPFTDNDIKQAIFSIPNHKSPGPDGFNSGFYKACWDIIGPLVYTAIHEFFENGKLPRFYGETRIVLLPKMEHPEKRSDL